MEYDRYNNLLKVELPRLLDLRSQLQRPGVQTLLAFQKLFYSKSAAIFSSATFLPEKLLGDSESRFRKDVEPLMNEIRTMGMFHGSGLTCKYTIERIFFKFSSLDSPALSSSTSTSTSTNDLPSPPEYSELSASSKPTNGKGSQLTSRPPPSSLEPNRSTRPAAPVPSRATQKNFVRAIYDFNSEDSDDLSFKMGDLIEVLDSSDQYGWWIGKSKQGKTGNFPSNYVMENK
jgi:amphiphysin